MTEDREFLKALDKKLWTAADKLRANLDAAVYKHAVLGLIFLKYVSDSFEIRQQQVEEQLRDPESDYFLDPADYDDDQYAEEIHQELEVRDYYVEENVFWVPALARWKTIQEKAKNNRFPLSTTKCIWNAVFELTYLSTEGWLSS